MFGRKQKGADLRIFGGNSDSMVRECCAVGLKGRMRTAIKKAVFQSTWADVRKYHKLEGLRQQVFIFLEAKSLVSWAMLSLRAEYIPGWSLRHSLVCRYLFSLCLLIFSSVHLSLCPNFLYTIHIQVSELERSLGAGDTAGWRLNPVGRGRDSEREPWQGQKDLAIHSFLLLATAAISLGRYTDREY